MTASHRLTEMARSRAAPATTRTPVTTFSWPATRPCSASPATASITATGTRSPTTDHEMQSMNGSTRHSLLSRTAWCIVAALLVSPAVLAVPSSDGHLVYSNNTTAPQNRSYLVATN